jgi:DNA-binding CsgD family transcriptional regulator
MTEANFVAESTQRPTGIPLLGNIPWGAHICIFYETKKDLLDTAIAYFEAGLNGNEFCIWAVSDPLSVTDAERALRHGIRDFDSRLAAGQIEILQGYDWYLRGNEFDPQRITGGWHDKLNEALSRGYEGMRASGNAFWFETNQWKDFCEYEEELDRSLAGRKMIALCTYSLRKSRAVELLDVARAHSFTLARRHGEWEFLETPELREAKHEIKRLEDAVQVLSNSFPGSRLLTARERAVLAQLVRGATAKEAGRALNISHRTVEFHRTNISKKLRAKNLVDLVRKVASGMR